MPCLASPRLALPRLAQPSLARPRRTWPSPAAPRPAAPRPALPQGATRLQIVRITNPSGATRSGRLVRQSPAPMTGAADHGSAPWRPLPHRVIGHMIAGAQWGPPPGSRVPPGPRQEGRPRPLPRRLPVPEHEPDRLKPAAHAVEGVAAGGPFEELPAQEDWRP